MTTDERMGRFEDRMVRFEERFDRFELRFERFVEYVDLRFQELPTREQWSQFATKTDLAQFATKIDLAAAQDDFTAQIASLRAEMRERFEIVHDRLVALENGVDALRSEAAQLRDQVRVQVGELHARIDMVEALARDNNSKLIGLREDIQQRFRHVNDQLTSLEQRLAA